MTLDPLAEERIGHTNFKRVTLTAESESYRFAEPQAEPHRAETLGHGRAQRGFHDLWALGQRLRAVWILLLTRVSRHGNLPAGGVHTEVVRARCPLEDWGR